MSISGFGRLQPASANLLPRYAIGITMFIKSICLSYFAFPAKQPNICNCFCFSKKYYCIIKSYYFA